MKHASKLIPLIILFLLTGCMEKGESNPVAVIETGAGVIRIELFKDDAPVTVENFIKLLNDSFYDGLIFHRIVNNFVIQAGAFYPNGTYKQSPYPSIKLEINEKLKHLKGSVGMARSSDPNSATSQFYICVKAQPSLDGNYAVFGRVIDGMDVVEKIASYDPEHTHSLYINGVRFDNWPEQDIINDVTIIRAYLET